MRKISIYNSYIKDNPTKRNQFEQKLRDNGFFTTKHGELLIVIGGDGTFLSAVKKRMYQNPIFVGFNAGNLGFFSEFSMNDEDEFIRILKKGEYWIENIPLYEVSYEEEGARETEYFLNDLSVERKGSRILHMAVQVNGKTLCPVAADGVIVSTAIGSSGYNLSAGGAVSLDHKGFLQIAPSNPTKNRAYETLQNALILNDKNEITVLPNTKKQRLFRVICDGRELKAKETKYIEIKKSEKNVRILRTKKYNPLEQIKNKILDFE